MNAIKLRLSDPVFVALGIGYLVVAAAGLYIYFARAGNVSPTLVKLIELELHKKPLVVEAVGELDLSLDSGLPAPDRFLNARLKRSLAANDRERFILLLGRLRYPESLKSHPLGESRTAWVVSTNLGRYYLYLEILQPARGKTEGPWVIVESGGLNDPKSPNHMPCYELADQDAVEMIHLLKKQ